MNACLNLTGYASVGDGHHATHPETELSTGEDVHSVD